MSRSRNTNPQSSSPPACANIFSWRNKLIQMEQQFITYQEITMIECIREFKEDIRRYGRVLPHFYYFYSTMLKEVHKRIEVSRNRIKSLQQ